MSLSLVDAVSSLATVTTGGIGGDIESVREQLEKVLADSMIEGRNKVSGKKGLSPDVCSHQMPRLFSSLTPLPSPNWNLLEGGNRPGALVYKRP